MKKLKNLLKERWFAYSLATCLAVAFYMLLSNLGNIFSVVGQFFHLVAPVIAGVVIAYIINPFCVLFDQKVLVKIKNEKIRYTLSVIIAILIVLFLIGILLFTLVPQIIASIQLFVENLDSYVETLQRLLKRLNYHAALRNINISRLTHMSDDLLQDMTDLITDNVSNIIGVSVSVGKSILNIMISSILAVYFLIDKKRMQENVRKFFRLILSKEKYEAVAVFWGKCNKILTSYVGCSVLDGLFVGCANAIFMAICGMPYILIVSVIVGVTNLAPTFGPIVGGVIGGFILLLVNPWYALWFVIFTMILQTIDGYVVKPKFFGNTLGVPGVWILITIIVGGRLFGVLGILCAIPFAAIVDFIYDSMVEKHEQRERNREKLGLKRPKLSDVLEEELDEEELDEEGQEEQEDKSGDKLEDKSEGKSKG